MTKIAVIVNTKTAIMAIMQSPENWLIFILTTTEGVDIRIWAPVKCRSLHGISHGGMKKSVIVVQSELYNLIV